MITYVLICCNLLIAGAVALIAYRQYRLAGERFKLDMFEKRFAVYKAAQRFLTVIFRDAKVDLDKLFDFRRDTQDATFLFGRRFLRIWVALTSKPWISGRPRACVATCQLAKRKVFSVAKKANCCRH